MNKLFEVIDKKEVNSSERSITAWGSRPVIDRDLERIHEKAKWKLDNFKLNPVLMLSHDYSRPPVGRVLWTKVTDEGLRFKAQFANTDTGKELFELYKSGVMNSFSIGFVPIKWTEPEEYKSNEPRRTYTELELLEISCVSVPSCPLANLIEATEKGLIKTKDFTDYIEFVKSQESSNVKKTHSKEATEVKAQDSGISIDSTTKEEEIGEMDVVLEIICNKADSSSNSIDDSSSINIEECTCSDSEYDNDMCKACGGKRKPKKEIKSISCTCPECGKTSESEGDSCGMCEECNVQMQESSKYEYEDEDDKACGNKPKKPKKEADAGPLGYTITDEEVEELVKQFEKMLDSPIIKEITISDLLAKIESMNAEIEKLKSEIKPQVETNINPEIKEINSKIDILLSEVKGKYKDVLTPSDEFAKQKQESILEIESEPEITIDLSELSTMIKSTVQNVMPQVTVDELLYESIQKARGKMFY